MERDALFSEFERIARAFQAPDQDLELDMQKVINALRSEANVAKEDVVDLDEAMHHPEKLNWVKTAVPPERTNFVPNTVQVEFFRTLIAKANEGMVWELPTTGQKYRVSPKEKTFTLVKNTEHDPDNWHGQNRVILELLGWRMVDSTSSLRTYTARHKDWLLVVTDFAIEDQDNPQTPGKNFPSGSRGQDAYASLATGGAFVHLSHRIGRDIMQHVLPDFGKGKFNSKLGNVE